MTTEPTSVPNLQRSAPQHEIDQFLKGLVIKYGVSIKLEDEGDEDGNCVIEVTSGDPDVVAAILDEVSSR